MVGITGFQYERVRALLPGVHANGYRPAFDSRTLLGHVGGTSITKVKAFIDQVTPADNGGYPRTMGEDMP
jgi:hypothetical protein